MTQSLSTRGLEVDVLVRRDHFEVEARFDAAPGETVALVGPNGSGKSTLVAAIAGLLPPNRGAIRAGEIELDSDAAHVAPEERPIGVVFQDLLLFPNMSAIENAAFPLRARGMNKVEARAKATELLDRLGLGERADAPPSELSGGESQRVALARALIAEPAILLLDEPLSALDVGARQHFRELLTTELKRFGGVRLIVTHDPIEASMLADRIVILEAGRITQIGTPEEIRNEPRSSYAADLVGVNLFRGHLAPLDEGTGVLTTHDGGEIVVRWPEGEVVGDVSAALRPTHVTLSRAKPQGSARNSFQGEVTSIAVESDRARVRVASRPPLVAEVTLGSIGRLELEPGDQIWATFKAVEVQVYPA